MYFWFLFSSNKNIIVEIEMSNRFWKRKSLNLINLERLIFSFDQRATETQPAQIHYFRKFRIEMVLMT